MPADDPFARLGFEARPWLDPDEVRNRVRELAARHHPDVNPDRESAAIFTQIQIAGRTLADPEKRIRALLESDGRAIGKPQPNPATTTLFMKLGANLTEARELLRQTPPASAIQRAMHLQACQRRAEELESASEELRARLAELEGQLRELDERWAGDRSAVLDALATLHAEWLFLGRWLGTVRETVFELQHR